MTRAVIEEIGNRYGRLTVAGEAGRNEVGRVLWRCLCDCGEESIVAGVLLRNGKTKSCGCLHIETCKDNGRATALPPGQANFNYLYGNYKRNAKVRGLPFDLSKEDFSFITKMNCHYCGREPAQKIGKRGQNGPYIYNGIDRVDNLRGYTMDNVVPCCGLCNKMKWNITASEFIEHARRIINHRDWKGE